VLALADRIVVLARGSVLAEGTPAEIERDSRVRDEYLGVVEHAAKPGRAGASATALAEKEASS